MKNRLAIFIFLVICIQMTSQNMYHKQIDLPFNSNSNLRDILGKEFLQKYFFFSEMLKIASKEKQGQEISWLYYEQPVTPK